MVMNVRESLKSERSVVVDNFSEENNPDDTADICSTSYQAKFKVHVNSHLFVTHINDKGHISFKQKQFWEVKNLSAK